MLVFKLKKKVFKLANMLGQLQQIHPKFYSFTTKWEGRKNKVRKTRTLQSDNHCGFK
jgi:hypothetical protein